MLKDSLFLMCLVFWNIFSWCFTSLTFHKGSNNRDKSRDNTHINRCNIKTILIFYFVLTRPVSDLTNCLSKEAIISLVLKNTPNKFSEVCVNVYVPCCQAWALFSLGSWWVLPESGPAAELSSVPSYQAVGPWFAQGQSLAVLGPSPAVLDPSLAVLGQPWHLPASQLSLPSSTANQEQRTQRVKWGNSSCCDTLQW